MSKKMGAPKGSGLKYTEAIADQICYAISEGMPLRKFCRENNIAWRTFYDWVEANADFAARVAKAREIGYDALAEDTREIADTPLLGTIKTYKASGDVETKEEDMLGHRKLQIETRLKLLACWSPKKYGTKVTHAGDPTAPIALILNGSDIDG
jgi:hypothetical protein